MYILFSDLRKEVLLCFSILTSGEKLFKFSSAGQLQIVNGIRSLSFGWVILGHTYAFLLLYIGELKRTPITTVQSWTSFKCLLQHQNDLSMGFASNHWIMNVIFTCFIKDTDQKYQTPMFCIADNITVVSSYLKQPAYQLITSATYAVDTFFFLR